MVIEMNKKKVIIIIGILVAIVIILRVLTFKTTTKRLENYLIDNGFVKEDNMYSKKLTDDSLDEYYDYKSEEIDSFSETLYFDTNSFQLIKMSFDYSDNVELYFNPTYNYTNDNLTYNYEINMNSTSVMIEGSYNSSENIVTCDIVSSKNINLNFDKENICGKVEFDVREFYDDAGNVIKDKKLLDEMKKK